MSRTLPSPDRLFDRPWQPGYPFRPRLSAPRRWGMLLLFILLATIIGGYWYLTDATRVRAMAESYLSNVLGGPVTVTDASLSIFEGLRLDGVEVRVDNGKDPDAVIFTAKTFHLQYNFRAMLRGKLEASIIRAIDPKVHLTENINTHRWNYQRMINRRDNLPKTPNLGPIVLPEIVLRNAQIQYSEVRDGLLVPLGSMAIEGKLSPGEEAGHYSFDLQSRGKAEGVGPTISGSIVMGTGQINARMKNFELGEDVRTILPAEVRTWWEQHDLAGRLNIPVVSYEPPRAGQPAKFTVETDLESVTMRARPEEWRSDDEDRRVKAARWSMELMRTFSAGGRAPETPPPLSINRPHGVTYNDVMCGLFESDAVRLHGVSGGLIFTQDGVTVSNFTGHIETFAIRIDGHIDGYSPHSPASLRISSPKTEDIVLPPAPRYISSLPHEIREIYERLQPEGKCELWIELDRPKAGGRLECKGEITILDGNFTFDRFPYPMRSATGKIIFDRDKNTGIEMLVLSDIRGKGSIDGPNKDSYITLNGWIGPFGPDAGVTIKIEGKNITSEPALRAAFPRDVRRSLSYLDAEGKGDYPQFTGNFECNIIRPIGNDQPWTIDVDIQLMDACGSLVAFPYPLEHVTGMLKIREGYIDIVNAAMKRGDASLIIDGRVSWGKHAEALVEAAAAQSGHPALPKKIEQKGDPLPEVALFPDIRVTARNVPIDKDLLGALPAERRVWLERIGLGGKLDIDGTILASTAAAPVSKNPTTKPAAASSLAYDLNMVLREGTVWPKDGTFAVSGLSGKLHLTPEKLELSDVKGARGEAMLSGDGIINFPGHDSDDARVLLNATAKNLALDSPLYQLLPESARSGWDQVNPEGSVDVKISYADTVPRPDATTQPAVSGVTKTKVEETVKAPDSESKSDGKGVHLTIIPRKLSVTPAAIPYRLDDVAGEVRIEPSKVVLDNLSGKHGDATIRISGAGTMKPDAPPVWDLKLSGEKVEMDQAMLTALPPTLSGLFQSLALQGNLDFAFERLIYSDRAAPPGGAMGAAAKPSPTTVALAESDASSALTAAAVAATPLAPTAAPVSKPDIDFGVSIWANNAAMDVGVPLSEVKGSFDLAGQVHGGTVGEMKGVMHIDTLMIAGRTASDFKARFFKPADQPTLQIAKMEAKLAGGEMAGAVELSFPDDGNSAYAIDLVIRNADVRQLAGESEKEIKGELSASLALQGNWSDPHTRRGRGDVQVHGKQMYKIPLVLGLLQITNLALPITKPFSEASSSYSVEGQRVTFESIELKSDSMTMTGSGHLDYDTKKVRMTFFTDSGNWGNLPFIGEFIKGAKKELLQIHVKGTLEEPKVEASSMNTLQTTVDEVFRDKK